MFGILKVWENRKIGDRIGKILMKMEFKVKQRNDVNSMQYVRFINNRLLEFYDMFDKCGPKIRDIFVEDLTGCLNNMPDYLQDDYAEIVTQLNCLEFFKKQINYELNNPEKIEELRKRRML